MERTKKIRTNVERNRIKKVRRVGVKRGASDSFISNFKKYFNNEAGKSQLNIFISLATVLISIIGIFTILSASAYLSIKYGNTAISYSIKQAIFVGIGIGAMLIFSKIDVELYHRYAKQIYIFSIILLFLVYVPGISVSIKGARRWLRLGFVFMPSDIAKPAVIIATSAYMIKSFKDRNKIWENLILPGIIMGIPLGLIFFQTDLSTTIVIALSLICLYWSCGLNKKFRLTFILIIVGIMILGYSMMKGYQRDRIIAFINPEKYYNDLSWQMLHGLFAVTRGGLTGVGYGRSVYKYGYLADEVNNDMIFAVFGEEYGFIGSIFLIMLITFITILVIKEALKARDKFSKYLCFGIGLIYFIQSMVNIGVSIAVIPNTGITLPFISSGGTSLVAFFIMFGIVLNVSRKNNFVISNERKLAKEKIEKEQSKNSIKY